MTMIGLIGLLSILAMSVSLWGIRWFRMAPLGAPLTESFLGLLGQSIQGFNARLLRILIQFFILTNAIILGVGWWVMESVPWGPMIIFDVTILFFFGLIFILLRVFTNALSAILGTVNHQLDALIQRILVSGIYLNLAFYGGATALLVLALYRLDAVAMVSICFGVLVVSFYFRSAGGAYKAAAEHQLSMVTDARESLTHPAKILRSSGTIIASLGGFYLDIFGSWLIAMGGFFICLNQTLDGTSFASLLGLPEVQWVLSVVGLTGVGMIGALVFIACRKNKRNIFLEVGYFIIGLTLIGSVFTTYWLDLIHVGQFNVMVVLMAVTVLGIIFFTHYLTSSNHRPIQFIARQAQYGSTNVLISSFFNGLVGNAVVTLILLVGLVSLYMALDMIGLMMVIIYGLSIIVVACNIKLFALISNQIIPVLDATPTPVNRPMGMGLSKMASSLEAIGNALSSVSGILTSVLLFLGAFLLSPFSEDMYSVPMIFGVGLGGVTITIFYAVSISGTYQTLMASSEEIQRQLRDIPLLSQPNKSHPNIQRLCDKHALNGLRAVTLPGVWIVIALGLMTMYLSNIGVYGVLIGMFMTVFVYSFFWSIFGDSVVAVFHAMQRGRYGGDRTSVFSGVTQAFLYAHYFQWVLAPTGVIIMKLAGMIALVMGLNEGGWL